MAKDIRIPADDARAVANDLVRRFGDTIDRVCVAGSLRREAQHVSDIELVYISRTTQTPIDLFGEQFLTTFLAEQVVTDLWAEGVLTKRKGEKGGTAWGYGARRAVYEGVPVDLFGTDADRWGMTLTIRTGDRDFTHKLVTQQSAGGLMPFGLRSYQARLWRGNRALDTPEESDVFDALGIPFIEPAYRSLATVSAIRHQWTKEAGQ